MTRLLRLRGLVSVALLAVLAACATPQSYNYAAFRQSRPTSILVLPPLNNSPEIKATAGMLAQATLPLAEGGYYVMPVAVVAETFRQNGLTQAADMHAAPPAKLREVFGADAALYINILDYGTRYAILDSHTIVTAEAKLVDLKTGALLWNGSATANNNEGQASGGGGLLGALITAAVKQIMNTLVDDSFRVAGTASARLLAPRPSGMLYGPHSPRYQQDGSF